MFTRLFFSLVLLAAVQVAAPLTFGAGLEQSITFNALPDLPYSTRPKSVKATASSGLLVTLTAEAGPIAVSNDQIIFLGVGAATIRASQAGDATYAAAPDVVRSFTVTPPENDSFANAKFILGNTTTFGTNQFCSVETGEPVHVPGKSGGASIWWRWRPNYMSNVTVTTRGSDFDTLLAVYTGSTLDSLTPVVANDDATAGTGTTSSVSFLAAANTYYYFAVDGRSGATGNVQLNVATISSNGGSPSINSHPLDASVSVGQTALFSVSYAGAPPVILAWQRRAAGTEEWQYIGVDGGAYTGGMSMQLNIVASSTMNGDQFRCVASNSYGSATSNPASLTISKVPQIITFAELAALPFSKNTIPLHASSSSGLPIAFSVTAGPAVVDGDQLSLIGTGVITIRASQSGNDTYAAAADVERSFVVSENFDSWSNSYFSAVELLDAAVSGANADPDGDGFVNLVEYALGSDPRASSSASAPTATATATDWTFTYTRPADRPDLTYAVERSTELTHWSSAGVTHTLLSTSNGLQTWSATSPIGSSSACFFRLAVTR